jgi:hypothetical protein
VLQGGHAACILAERVEKATDNRTELSLCHPKWLTLILWRVRPSLASAHFPTPLPTLGPTTISRTHRSRAEGFR